MDAEHFAECREIDSYDAFMETYLAASKLRMEDYQQFMPVLFEIVPERPETEPIAMYEAIINELGDRWVASERLPFHGPWHHGLAGAILLQTLRNNGHGIGRDRVIEALQRGLMVPAAACGFLGVCGAGTGAGLAVAMVCGSTPFCDEERRWGLVVNGEIMRRVGLVGGPRCCALSTYLSLHLGAKKLSEHGFELPSASIAGCCSRHADNTECHGDRCPCFSQ
jgi:hypothetical protein